MYNNEVFNIINFYSTTNSAYNFDPSLSAIFEGTPDYEAQWQKMQNELALEDGLETDPQYGPYGGRPVCSKED